MKIIKPLFFVALSMSVSLSRVHAQTNLRPCRIEDTLNPDVLFLGLGNPDFSKVKSGDVDLQNDAIVLKNNTRIPNYFKTELGIPYFKAIDKSTFKLPANGWCSWYYYYQDLDLESVLLNTKWMGTHLKDYGLKYIQIDDAWQDKGIGANDNRDWTTINSRFSKYGMDSLAMYIKQYGFTPGLWIVPHGQSNPEVVKKSNAFLVDKKNKKLFTGNWGGWVGEYALDPTSKNMPSYLNGLFNSFKSQGYDYFKIDGQSLILPDYVTYQKNFSNPKIDAVSAYRNTLKAIRESVGKDVFLLGCWQTPLEGIGYFNGSRSNGDIYSSVKGFGSVLEAVRAGYFLHNTAWYVDPDPVMVGEPLTLDFARLWGSVIGMTGMSTFCSEKMFDLAPSRVDIVKKIFPAQDIYPVDLFRYSKNKTIYDLKIKNTFRAYDVVGIFNFQADKKSTSHIDFEKLGLEKDAYYHIYNFWDEEYVGCFNYGLFINLNPASCKIYSVTKADTVPQLISTNRHITQGAYDVLDAKLELKYKNIGSSKSVDKAIYTGKSLVVKDNEYKLVFATPIQTPMGYQLQEIKFADKAGKVINTKATSFGSFIPTKTGEVDWVATFVRVKNYASPQKGDFYEKLKLSPIANNKLQLNFDKGYGICFGYLVERNSKPLGYALESPIMLNRRSEDFGAKYTATETYNNFLLSKSAFSTKDSIEMANPKVVLNDDGEQEASVCYQLATDATTEINFFGNGNKSFVLNKKFKTLKGNFKVENYTTHYYDTKGKLEIWGDGKLLYQSAIKSKKDQGLELNISIENIQTLVFKAKFEQIEINWGKMQISQIELIK